MAGNVRSRKAHAAGFLSVAKWVEAGCPEADSVNSGQGEDYPPPSTDSTEAGAGAQHNGPPIDPDATLPALLADLLAAPADPPIPVNATGAYMMARSLVQQARSGNTRAVSEIRALTGSGTLAGGRALGAYSIGEAFTRIGELHAEALRLGIITPSTPSS